VIMHLHCCVAYLEMIIKVCSQSSFHWNIEPFSRKSQLNDNKLNSYTTVYQIEKEKPNWNQVSPIKIEGQTSQCAFRFTLLFSISLLMT
jgi:hypothetical protein